jgi:hypothetical protein
MESRVVTRRPRQIWTNEFFMDKNAQPLIGKLCYTHMGIRGSFRSAFFSFSINFLLVLKQSDPSRQILRYLARS